MKITIEIDNNTQVFTNPQEAISKLTKYVVPEFNVEVYNIGGYELLQDGTQNHYNFYDKASMLEFIEECGLEMPDNTISSEKFILALEEVWDDMHDDGGGSGWFEIEGKIPNNLI